MKHPVASQYWRSLDQIENTPEFQQFMHREFPVAASEFPEGVSRRRWMQLMGASFALAAVSGCRWEAERFAEFANRPEGYIPGKPEKFATNFDWTGAPRHVVVTKYDGRPIKIDGNELHPHSLGGSDAYTQGATLALYDPDRSQVLKRREGGETISRSWADFDTYLSETIAALGEGAPGLAVLFQPTTSVTLHDALDRLVERLPQARLFAFEPLGREQELAGAELAFGKKLRTHLSFDGARVIAAFDADPLVEGPQSVRLAREFANGRDPGPKMSRLYCVESQFSISGASADHRFAVRSVDICGVLAEVRDLIASAGAKVADTDKLDSKKREDFVRVLAADLLAAKAEGVVVVGPRQAAEAHAIAHEINGLLGSAGKLVTYSEEPGPKTAVGSIADLVGEIAAVRVTTLLIIGGNPLYDAPADLDFAASLAKANQTIHLSYYDNETSQACGWSIPEAHPMEVWSDAAAWDGTLGVCQPMIDPIVGGRSPLEILSLVAGDGFPNAEQLVRDAVGRRAGGLDEAGWLKLLHDGVLADSASAKVAPPKPKAGVVPPATTVEAEGLELVFTCGAVHDGRLANNGWLQELPDFVTKLTWDNAAIMSPATAAKVGAKQGELTRITVGEKSLLAPVYVLPGQAEGSIGLALGYGRTAAGHVGGLVDAQGGSPAGYFANGIAGRWLPLAANPVGVNAYPLRNSKSTGFVGGVKAAGTGNAYQLATTQDHFMIDTLGLEAIGHRVGELIREADLSEFTQHSDFAKHRGPHVPDVQLWNELTYDDGRAWGMSIDLNKCIGCSSCVVACQAENNIPIVGKDQVSRGREMHWIRIDRFFKGFDPETGKHAEQPQMAFQPMACQHCETAPCEEVCPVAATLHSDEGLNDMVYNRCVGTRYCSNNCPFKVRRFNYFHSTGYLEQANNELMKLLMNPEVTVRGRGMMEKCTYCTQRISTARITAKNEERALRDGDVVTACQQACPTRAIEFGDLNDPKSRVSQAHANDRSYTMLEELRIKPRTAYLARIRNPHPALAIASAAAHGGHGHGDSHKHESGHHESGHKDKADHAEPHGDGAADHEPTASALMGATNGDA